MSYVANSDNDKKQVPAAIPDTSYGKAITPAPAEINDRPNYILVNTIGNYSFAYESGSLSTYISGSKIENAAGGPVRLDINPVVWTSHNGQVGDITFVYTGNVG